MLYYQVSSYLQSGRYFEDNGIQIRMEEGDTSTGIALYKVIASNGEEL